MISTFESMARRCPQRTCFSYVDEAGVETAFSYRETRMLSAAVASLLRARGVRRGDFVIVDLPNCPMFVFLALAAAYGDFVLAAVNHRLSPAEKAARSLEVEHRADARVACRIDGARAADLLARAKALLAGDDQTGSRLSRPSFAVHDAAATAEARSTRALGRAAAGRAARRRRDETSRQDAVEEIIHFAERSAHVFDPDALALVIFTSGTTGKSKAVPLTWSNLCRSASLSNAALNRRGEGLWQAVLPLFHVGGFQVVVRSLLNGNPFILYCRFDAGRVLGDAVRRHATHVPVVDKMLQDLLAVAERSPQDSKERAALRGYACILLGGGALNPGTLGRAVALRARVYASYGMTETSSQIAHARVTESFDGGLRLLPGYAVRIVDPGADGFGRLAVRGPGVFNGYLNAQAPRTIDGFFLTGDTAALREGKLHLRERTGDMFVSGGENIYPAEIRSQILRVPGVADAHVFGAPDKIWGRRPVAFVEGSCSAPFVRAALERHLSKLHMPRHICMVGELPRLGIGKIDRAAVEALYDQRIELARITLHRIRIPFVEPFKTAKGTLRFRESLIVEVEDHLGRTGLGECVSFETDWYLPETLGQDERVLREVLAPLALGEVYLHPAEAAESFAAHPDAAPFPMARGALEPALWDLYGKIVQKPLWRLIGGKASSCAGVPPLEDGEGPAALGGARIDAPAPAPAAAPRLSECPVVPAGAVVGLASPSESVAAVRRCVEAGYRRVKMKIAPGNFLASVRAVRAAFPDLMLTLDANQSFTEADAGELRLLDALEIAWIEEPLDPRRAVPASGPGDLFARLSRLQRTMGTPLCLDESVVGPGDFARASGYSNLRCYALKIAKMGGVKHALDFVRAARARGIMVWMGGMYDTGISKRLHAAFETLPGVTAPGDVGSTSRYFAIDVTDPPYTADRGSVTLNRGGHAYGLGCELNRGALARVLVGRTVLERSDARAARAGSRG